MQIFFILIDTIYFLGQYTNVKQERLLDIQDLAGNVPSLTFSKTQRGRIMLIYEGYKYVENRQSAKNIFWRCSRYVKHHCRAMAVTTKEMSTELPVIRHTGPKHTHGPEQLTEDELEKIFKLEDMNLVQFSL